MRNISNEDFEKMYYMYKDMIYHICYPYVKNSMDADDIVQDVFMKYLNSDEQFATQNNEKYWLIRVTINTSKTFVTSSWKKRVFLDDDLLSRTTDVKEYKDTSLFDEVCKLPPKYKNIIILFYYEDMKISDIAKSLNISESACKKRLERARNILRNNENKNTN